MGSKGSQVVHQQFQFSITATRHKQSLQVDIRGTAQFAQNFDSIKACQVFSAFYQNSHGKQTDFLIKSKNCREFLKVEKWSLSGGWAWMGFYFLCASFEVFQAHQDRMWEEAKEIINEYAKKLIILQEEIRKQREQIKMMEQSGGNVQEL